MLTDKRLQQLLEYAEALAACAEHGRGNVKDTADIVKALQELQALKTFDPAPLTPQPRRAIAQKTGQKPRPKLTVVGAA